MTTLITGAGLIGCHLARRLADRGDRVVLFDLVPNRPYSESVVGTDKGALVAADMRDMPALVHALKTFSVDTVVHTAGLIGKRVSENSYTGATNNILGTINVLEAARLHGLRRLVYVSTFGAYDRSKIPPGPVREDAAIGGRNLYTVTKACSEHLVQAYADLYRLDYVIVRPGAVFGRGHYAGGSSVGQAMRDLARNAIRGKPFTLDTKVYFANEYVYAKDVARALQLACEVPDPRQRIYNAGSGVVSTAHDLARAVREVVAGIEVELVGDDAGERGKIFPMDLSRSEAELGYRPQFTLKAGLSDYIGELKKDA
jgi:nucleoside-diphosphate-sugar epimerase